MVSRPELTEDANYATGIAAAVLFVVLAAVFLAAGFDEHAGFDQGASLVAGIGYALMDLQAASPVAVEGFMATFEIVGVVLVAATVAAVTLARRETDDEASPVTALTDGGRENRPSTADEEVDR